jgi:hypothetical protein
VQTQLLRRAAALLRPGGRLIIKDCGIRPSWKRWFNRLHDALYVPFESTWHRSEEEWAALLREAGLEATTRRLDRGSPYAHILIVGVKP